MRFQAPAMAFVLMVSCKACDEEVEPTLLAPLDGSSPASFRAIPAMGVGTVDVPVQLVNVYGAPVPGGALDVQVEGTTATPPSSTLTVDSWGYATLSVSTMGPEVFTVTPVASDDGATAGAPVRGWSVSGAVLDPGLMPAWPLDGVPGVSFMVALANGFFAAQGRQAWFLGVGEGDQPHPLLDVPEDILQVQAVQLDADGVTDVMVRTETYLFLLRGRPAGGMGWLGGFQSQSGMAIFGASVEDVNGDKVADLAVGITNQLDTRVQLLVGDGTGEFTLDSEIPFDYLVSDLLLAHSDNDTTAELNLLDSTSQLVRYAVEERDGENVWLETTSSGVPTELDIPPSFLGAADLTGLGLDELFVLGPPDADSVQKVRIYSIEDGTCVTSTVIYDASAAIADLSGDDLPDLVFHQGGSLSYDVFSGLGDNGCPNLTKRDVSGFPDTGILAVGDLDGEEMLDVGVATAGLRLYPGTTGTAEGVWAAREVEWSPFSDANLAGPYDLLDRDDDTVLDTLVGVTLDITGAWHLGAWQIRQDDEGGKPALWSVSDIALEAQPLDGARCDDTYFLLTDGLLLAWSIGDQGELSEEARAAIGATAVACGALEGGAVVGVVDEGGATSLLDASLGVVSQGTAEGGVDLASADVDGDGTESLVACEATGCSILAADLDVDGADEIYTSSRSGLLVETPSGSDAFAGAGALSLADADGDGMEDLLGVQDGVVWVWRNTGQGVAPAVGLHARRQTHYEKTETTGVTTFWADLVGPAFFGDIDGDGVPELMLQDSAASDLEAGADTWEGALYASRPW